MANVNIPNAKLFTLVFVHELVAATQFFKSLEFDQDKYSDALKSTNVENVGTTQRFPFFHFFDKKYPRFYFTVNVLLPQDKAAKFSCNYFPGDIAGTRKTIEVFPFSQIKEHFDEWSKLIHSYEESEKKLNDDFEESYYNTFYEEIKIDVPDFETAPFSPEEQEILYLKLQFLLTFINQTETLTQEDKKSLVDKITETINLLGSSTKKKIVQAFASIKAKLQKHGPKLLKEIKEAAIKEAAKAAIRSAANGLVNLWNLLT